MKLRVTSGGHYPQEHVRKKDEKSFFCQKKANQLEFDVSLSISRFKFWKTNFSNTVARGSYIPNQAMPWVSEIEKAKTLQQLFASQSITGVATGNFETLDSNMAIGLMTIKRVLVEGEKSNRALDS